MIQIDLQSRTPIYEQLKNQIIRLSMLGILDENERLPSVRSLAREIGVNPNTVQKAYQDLERDGIIYTVSGKGSFVSSDLAAKGHIREKALRAVEESAREAASCGCGQDEILERARKGASITAGGSASNDVERN